jgi:hypothetical protein
MESKTASGNTGMVNVVKLIKVYTGTTQPVLDSSGNYILKDNTPGDPDYISSYQDLCDCPVDDEGTGCV